MGKDKLKRFAENLTFECMVQPEFEEIFHKDHPLKGRWHKDFFHNDNPIKVGHLSLSLSRRLSIADNECPSFTAWTTRVSNPV